MSKAYDEIMDRIVVNDDMRRRVLQNVEKEPANNVELQEDSAVWEGEEKRLRCMRRYRISRYLSGAACLALLITGAAVIPQINRGQQEPTSGQEMVGVVNGMETVASAEELSQKVGVPVSDLKDLPFTVEHTKYTNGWGEFAQIDYEGVDADGDAQSLCYRKGTADGYALAVWNEGGYAYAVSVTKKITKDEILQIVEEIVKK